MQIGKGSRGDVTILPTLVVNNHQYRGESFSPCYFDTRKVRIAPLTNLITGKLEKGAVLKAVCSGFEETTEPAVCLSDGMDL